MGERSAADIANEFNRRWYDVEPPVFPDLSDAGGRVEP